MTRSSEQVKKVTLSPKLAWLILLGIVLLQFGRILVFVQTYGGLIQDSGWSLGIARSLAERGSYTTMVATMVDPTVPAGLSLKGDFHIQNQEGGVYFRSDRPALILPQALIFKLFGFNFWTYRAGSLLFCALFLLVASALLRVVAGLPAVLLFHLLLYFYPHLLINLSFQTLGEMAALAYLSLAFTLFLVANQKKSRRASWFFGSGLLVGLALYSKLIATLALSGLGWLMAWLLYKKEASRREVAVFLAGCVLFPGLWELLQLVCIIWLTDFQTYLGHIGYRYDFFQNYGRGQDEVLSPPLEFAWDKLRTIGEISQPQLLPALLTLLVILLGGAYLIWSWREDRLRRQVAFLFWGAWLTHYLWFIFRSTGGVTRYNWLALIFGVLTLSLVTVFTLQQLFRAPNGFRAIASIALLLLLLSNLWAQRLAINPIISAELVEAWRQKHIYGKYIQLPSMVIPSQAQNEVIDYLNRLAGRRVFYALGYYNGEIATQTGRLFYPLERRPYMPAQPGDVVIINPGLISAWRKPPDLETAVLAEVEKRCPKIIFRNDYYILCGLD